MAVSAPLDEGHRAPEDIGATLRHAREAAGFSIADVAQRLRLSRHLVENLEAERFDLFPVSVFLRGYLTSYARLLGIDSEPLLEAYDRRGFGPPQLHSQDTARSTPRGSEFTVTVTTLVVIAALIVLSALWWREQWTEEGGRTGTEMEQTEPGGVTAGPTTLDESPFVGPEPVVEARPERVDAGDPPADPESPVPSDSVVTGTARGEVSAPGEPAEGEDAPGTASAERPEDAGDIGPGPVGAAGPETGPGVADAGTGAEGPDADTDTDTAAATADAGEAATGDEAPATAVAAGGPSSLVIRISEDCWLMVRDAEQRLIYRDLAVAGETLELTGVAPIRVVAGYAHGIEIEFNGAPFDLSPFIEQDTGTARFRLGA